MPHPISTSTSSGSRAVEALDRVSYFSDLPDNVRVEIAAAALLKRFGAGQVIYLQGEPAEAVYILAKGWVKSIRLSPDGREQAMLFLRSGEVFGEVAVFTGQPYPGTVIALEEVEILKLPQSIVLDLVARHNTLAQAVIRLLAERILYYVTLVEDLTLRSLESRLALTLLHHAEQVSGQLIVPRRRWTTFNEMATRLGTVRDVLGRALRSLEAAGAIRVERQAIVILEPEELIRRGNTR